MKGSLCAFLITATACPVPAALPSIPPAGSNLTKQPAPVWGKPVEGFRLSLRSAQAIYALGEQVTVAIWEQNVSNQAKGTLAAHPLEVYQFKVTTEDGKAVAMSKHGKQVFENVNSRGSRGWTKLKPNQESSLQLELTEIWAMRKPGKYQIIASMEVPKAGDEKKFVTVTSNPLTITIAPAKEKKGK